MTGVQTCALPIFVNKMDRDIRDPIELLDEIEAVLGIAGAPINWPIGMGRHFKGVYDLHADVIHIFESGHNALLPPDTRIQGLDSPEARALLDDEYESICDEIELVKGASHPFDQDAFLQGQLTPVFFGTALGNFGVREMLDKCPATVFNVRVSSPCLSRAINQRVKIQLIYAVQVWPK